MNADYGPEYLPFPKASPGKARQARGAHGTAAGIPAPQAAVAMLAAAIAGTAGWLAAAHHATAIRATPHFATPSPIEAPPDAPPPQSPRPLLGMPVVQPETARAALPQPPMAIAATFVPSAANTARTAPVSLLFNRHIGGFIPFQDQR